MFFALLLFWIVLNGKVTLEIVIIGLLVSSMVFAFVCKYMNYSVKAEVQRLKIAPLYVRYAGYLLYEIVVSNYKTLHMLTTYKYVIEPAILTYELDLQSTLHRVLVANSITLTPGTITISLEGAMITVHAIDRDFLEDIESSKFIQLLQKIEKISVPDKRYQ